MKVIDKNTKLIETVLFKTNGSYLVSRTKTSNKGINCNRWFVKKDFEETFTILEGSFDDVKDYISENVTNEIKIINFIEVQKKSAIIFDEGKSAYYNSLLNNLKPTKGYQYTGPKCSLSCKFFPHYETYHSPDCPFYAGSLSERYDTLLKSNIR